MVWLKFQSDIRKKPPGSIIPASFGIFWLSNGVWRHPVSEKLKKDPPIGSVCLSLVLCNLNRRKNLAEKKLKLVINVEPIEVQALGQLVSVN